MKGVIPMSLITKQIEKLRAYAKDRKGELAKLIADAADTIEMLSAKLHASQMKRSSQYYHGGWIPVSERLPSQWDKRYLVSLAWGGVGVMEYKSTGFHNYGSFTPVPIETVTAWMPLPEPLRLEGEQE